MLRNIWNFSEHVVCETVQRYFGVTLSGFWLTFWTWIVVCAYGQSLVYLLALAQWCYEEGYLRWEFAGRHATLFAALGTVVAFFVVAAFAGWREHDIQSYGFVEFVVGLGTVFQLCKLFPSSHSFADILGIAVAIYVATDGASEFTPTQKDGTSIPKAPPG